MGWTRRRGSKALQYRGGGGRYAGTTLDCRVCETHGSIRLPRIEDGRKVYAPCPECDQESDADLCELRRLIGEAARQVCEASLTAGHIEHHYGDLGMGDLSTALSEVVTRLDLLQARVPEVDCG